MCYSCFTQFTHVCFTKFTNVLLSLLVSFQPLPGQLGEVGGRSSISSLPQVSARWPSHAVGVLMCPEIILEMEAPRDFPRPKAVILSQHRSTSPRTCARLGCSTRSRSSTTATPRPARSSGPWTPPAAMRPLPGYHPCPRTTPAGARPRRWRRSRRLLVVYW